MLDDFITECSDNVSPNGPRRLFRKRRGKRQDIMRADYFISFLVHTNEFMENLMQRKDQIVEGSEI